MKTLTALMLALSLTACHAIKPTTPHLAGTPQTISERLFGTWQLHGDVIGHDGKPLMLSFDAKQVRVLNGCNLISARHHVNHDTHVITMTDAVSTRKLCDDTLMKTDALAVNLMNNDAHLGDNKLIMHHEGRAYVFVKVPD